MKKLLLLVALLLVAMATFASVRAVRLVSRQVTPGTPAAILIDAHAAAERLAGALKFPTITWGNGDPRDADAFADLASYLDVTFPHVRELVTREVVAGQSLLYTWKGQRDDLPPLVLTSHLDVVPVDTASEAQWSHPPFSGVVADGSIWGRGAIDDKSGVVGLLEAVEGLLASRFTPTRTVYLAFGHNEEGDNEKSGARAIADLLESRGVRNATLMDEGGVIYDKVPGVHQPVAFIGIAEKAAMGVELRAHGEGGHASMPPFETASGILAAAITKVERTPMPARFDGAAKQMFDTLTPEMNFGMKLIFSLTNLWPVRAMALGQLSATPESNALVRTTMATTMLEASPKDNVLPSIAKALLNVRLLPGDSAESVISHVRNVIADDRVDVVTRFAPNATAPTASTSIPEFSGLARAIRAIYPETLVSPYLTIAATDAPRYSRIASNLYRFLPIYQDGAIEEIHGVNEHVRIDAYEKAIRIYATIIRDLSAAK